jgi:ribose-phosphate pyrophosphokinase
MKYEVIEYPDGQISIKINEYTDELLFRINSYKDLFVLKAISDVIIHNNQKLPILTIPCLFGQRSDRRFSENQSFDLKNICDFINSCNFSKVQIYETHSDVSLALVNNSVKVSTFPFIKQVIEDINSSNIVLVSPDSGAYKRVFKYAEYLNLPLVAANKYRDLDGKITLNILGDVKGKDCVILDDIADGAWTFYLLAKQLKEQGASKVFLYVTHGYFNKGFELLREYIDHIYCTDSVREFDVKDYVKQFKI